MPHAPARVSRRFIAAEVRTAPMDFKYFRQATAVVGACFTASGETCSKDCLIRVVLVVRFEMIDGIIESLIERQVRQPALTR
jgi:hypothetical protein